MKTNEHVELQLVTTHQGLLQGHRYASLVTKIESTLRPPPRRTLLACTNVLEVASYLPDLGVLVADIGDIPSEGSIGVDSFR